MSSPSPTAVDPPTSVSSISEAISTCTTATPGRHGNVPADACNSNYPFDPSFEANCAFAILFGLSLAVHLAQAVGWRKSYCWVIIVGAAWEFVAFTLKALGALDQQNMGYAIAGTLLFLLAPLWINAFAFMTGARIVYYVLPGQKIWKLKATWLTKAFVWIDILCFLVQAAGCSMMSNNDISRDDPVIRIGQYIYMGGCGAQLGFILLFCGLIARLYIKTGRLGSTHVDLKRVRLLIWVIFAVLVLIMIRIIFRLVEFGPGPNLDNPIYTDESFAIGLDALPMVLALILLNFVHPGWVLHGSNSEFPRLNRHEKKQVKAETKRIKEEKKAAKQARKGKT